MSLLRDAVAFLRGAEETAYEAARADDSEPTLSACLEYFAAVRRPLAAMQEALRDLELGDATAATRFARSAREYVFLRRGRWIEPGRRDEVLASEGFAAAHGLNPGDHVPAVINGRLRRLRIVGIALSPEFIYSIRPGELVPDDKRFGIFWMDRQALGAAFDMEGGFNDVVLRLAPGTPPDETIARLDRILEPYGGLGAIPRALQLSHWTVENELAQLQSFGFMN